MTTAGLSVDDVRGQWEAAAEGWRRHAQQLTEHTRPVQVRMRELVEARAGETVVDLAAGLGDLGRALADDVVPGGRVICSDVSPRMLGAARERAGDVDGLAFQVLDAHRIDLDDDVADAVTCKMGLMLLPDPATAAAECRRVLRHGGRLVAATWGPLEHNLWLATIGAAVIAHGHAPPTDPAGPGGISSLSTPDALHDLLSPAGFTDVEVERVDVPSHAASFDDYWQLRCQTSGPLTGILQQLEAGEVDGIRATCEEFAAHLRAPDGSYTFPGQAIVARAR